MRRELKLVMQSPPTMNRVTRRADGENAKEKACGLKETARGSFVSITRSGLWLFDEEMRAGAGTGKNAEAQNIGDDESRLASAIHAKVCELVKGKTLRMEGAKTGFVAKERPAGHCHAAREQSFDR